MQELNGHNAQLLDMLEINQNVVHAGLTELLKLTMIDYVLKLTEHSLKLYQLLIPPHVVDSSVVSVWDVTEDKSELHGLGSKIPELSQEQILVTNNLVILTLCHNVDITLTKLNIQIVLQLLKFHQLVTQNVQETAEHIVQINTKLHHLIH